MKSTLACPRPGSLGDVRPTSRSVRPQPLAIRSCTRRSPRRPPAAPRPRPGLALAQRPQHRAASSWAASACRPQPEHPGRVHVAATATRPAERGAAGPPARTGPRRRPSRAPEAEPAERRQRGRPAHPHHQHRVAAAGSTRQVIRPVPWPGSWSSSAGRRRSRSAARRGRPPRGGGARPGQLVGEVHGVECLGGPPVDALTR